jgi:hypothetical protein
VKSSNNNSRRNVWIVHGADVGDDVIVGADVGVDVGKRAGISHVRGGTWRSKLGLPGLTSVITPSRAFCLITIVTSSGVRVGSSRRMMAATPATWGEAIEVPEILCVEEFPPIHALVISPPCTCSKKIYNVRL